MLVVKLFWAAMWLATMTAGLYGVIETAGLMKQEHYRYDIDIANSSYTGELSLAIAVVAVSVLCFTFFLFV